MHVKIMELSSKSFGFFLTLSFLGGIFVGYKIKSLRVKYLQTRRDFLARQLIEAQKKVDIARS